MEVKDNTSEQKKRTRKHRGKVSKRGSAKKKNTTSSANNNDARMVSTSVLKRAENNLQTLVNEENSLSKNIKKIDDNIDKLLNSSDLMAPIRIGLLENDRASLARELKKVQVKRVNEEKLLMEKIERNKYIINSRNGQK